MPGKTPTQRIDELTTNVQELETAFEKHRELANYKLQFHQDRDKDHTRIEDELRSKLVDLNAKHAALEERARNQEKTSDRGWNIGQAAIVSIISMIGGALLSLLVQLAIKK